MQASRELDALVAEKVMGLEPWPGKAGCFKAPIVLHYQTPKPCLPPEYSTDIAAAWQVVEKMQETCEVSIEQKGTGWKVYFDAEWRGAETVPHAICLAALEAVGVQL